jgi:hypothetical protein
MGLDDRDYRRERKLYGTGGDGKNRGRVQQSRRAPRISWWEAVLVAIIAAAFAWFAWSTFAR